MSYSRNHCQINIKELLLYIFFKEVYIFHFSSVQFSHSHAAPIHSTGESGFVPSKWAFMILENNGEDTVDEIRQGTPANYINVWTKGDPIPAASEEMERYFAMEKAYYQWIDSSYRDADGNVNIVVNDSEDEFFAWQDRLEDARKAVPEWN